MPALEPESGNAKAGAKGLKAPVKTVEIRLGPAEVKVWSAAGRRKSSFVEGSVRECWALARGDPGYPFH